MLELGPEGIPIYLPACLPTYGVYKTCPSVGDKQP